MSTQIHPTAIVNPSAYLDENVIIGPYTIIGEHVKIGASTTIESFAQVLGYTEIGKKCQIFPYALVGIIPQDLKYKGEESYLIVGNNNLIREYVTINPGTNIGAKTIIGNNNLIMAYSHIAHDCIIGNNNILANGVTLAGHVEIEDNVVIGGLVAAHQFCRIGSFAIIGGCSKVVQDIPPYSMCDGHPTRIYGLNLKGLKRANFDQGVITVLKKAFKILFWEKHTIQHAQQLIKTNLPSCKEIDYLTTFISLSKRGIGR